jgi:hypothetical protein
LLHPTPADLAVLTALGFHGLPPIGPTVIVVSVLFPLGSLYFGFVQQRRAAVTQTDLADDAMEMRRRIQQAQYEAQLADALASKRAAQARGAVGMVRAGMQAARTPDSRISAHPGAHVGGRAGYSAGSAFDADDDLVDEDARGLEPGEDTDIADLDGVEVYVPDRHDGRLNGHADTTPFDGGDDRPFR